MQETILRAERTALLEKENHLADIPSQYEEIMDSLTEEEKETEILNETGDAFVSKEVTKKLKELKTEEKTLEISSFIEKLKKVERLQKEEKDLKAKIKSETTRLHALTKENIENLTDEQVYMLLEKKWIENLVSNLFQLPDRIVDELVNKIQTLSKKYETTYFDLEKQIKETERTLCSMIDELEGNEFDMKGLSEFKALLMGE